MRLRLDISTNDSRAGLFREGRRGFILLISLLAWPSGGALAQDQAPVVAAPQAPVRVGGNIPAPRQIRRVPPVYPPEAQRDRITGVVVLETVVDPRGRISNVTVLRSVPGLDQAAIDAVRQWEYEPTLVAGKPVAVILTVTVDFKLDAPAAARGADGTLTVLRLTRADGIVEIWQLSAAQVSGLPRWNPADTPEPPLPIAKAIATASEWMRRRHGQALDLNNVILSTPSTNVWIYVARFFPPRGAAPPGRQFAAVVLMDGSVLEPREEPAPGR